MTLDEFIKNKAIRNAWIADENEHLAAYLRRGARIISSPNSFGYLRCLDLANVHVEQEHRNKGSFTRWIERLIARHDLRPEFDALYVENVLDPYHHRWWTDRGFVRQDVEFGLHSFYKLLTPAESANGSSVRSGG